MNGEKKNAEFVESAKIYVLIGYINYIVLYTNNKNPITERGSIMWCLNNVCSVVEFRLLYSFCCSVFVAVNDVFRNLFQGNFPFGFILFRFNEKKKII